MTELADGLSLRVLSADDSSLLEAFRCRLQFQPWTDEVEEAIREQLAYAVGQTKSSLTSFGLFVANELIGVVALYHDARRPDVCICPVLAVRVGHRGNGFGGLLKRETLHAARAKGADVLVSYVHPDNEPMLKINFNLGANIEPAQDRPPYLHCIVDLRNLPPHR